MDKARIYSTGSTNNAATLEQILEQQRYHALKQLLFATEEQRLRQIEYYLQNPSAYADKIAQALPASIERADPEGLRKALKQLVQSCIVESVQNDTEMYTEALYPVIFPAIKKSIAEAFKEMLQSLNYALEQGFSLNRLAWHFEAWRSGVPYRDIVLRHTLTYQVEQVFLIHRETGLLLAHQSIAGIERLRDSDAVSAMLTAIQDFISDSFSNNQHDLLDTVEIGNYQVLLSRGTHAVLAGVVKGIAPYALRQLFNDCLNKIQKLYTPLLKDFDGDNSSLAVTEPYLAGCLISEAAAVKKNQASPKHLIAVLIVLLGIFTYWRYGYWEFAQRAEDYLQLLRQQHGIIITEYDYNHKKLHIKGLYDPLSLHPAQQYQNFLTPDEVDSQWQVYHSLQPDLLLRTLTNLLQPPPTVQLSIQRHILHCSGTASAQWIAQLAQLKPALVGLRAIDSTELNTYQQQLVKVLQPPDSVQLSFTLPHLALAGTASIDWLKTVIQKLPSLSFVETLHYDHLSFTEEQQLQQLISELQQTAVYFGSEKFELVDNHAIIELADKFKQLLFLAEKLDKKIQIIITGHADSLGSLEYNQKLANNRALYIVQLLKQQGLQEQLFSIGTELLQKKSRLYKSNYLYRKVDFEIILDHKEIS